MEWKGFREEIFSSTSRVSSPAVVVEIKEINPHNLILMKSHERVNGSGLKLVQAQVLPPSQSTPHHNPNPNNNNRCSQCNNNSNNSTNNPTSPHNNNS
jgi:hypothetical protein